MFQQIELGVTLNEQPMLQTQRQEIQFQQSPIKSQSEREYDAKSDRIESQSDRERYAKSANDIQQMNVEESEQQNATIKEASKQSVNLQILRGMERVKEIMERVKEIAETEEINEQIVDYSHQYNFV